MRRTISSKWTLTIKIFNFVLAALPLVWIAALLINFRTSASGSFPTGLAILAVVFGLVWSGFFLWANSRLKFVSMDEENLYVSRLLDEKPIPLAEIEKVSLTTIGAAWVCVRFKSPTAFGRQIFFQPTLERLFVTSLQRFHPIVDELNNRPETIAADAKFPTLI